MDQDTNLSKKDAAAMQSEKHTQLSKRKRSKNSSKAEVNFGLEEVREKILRKDFGEGDQVLVKLGFLFEEVQNSVNKKWLKSMIVHNLTQESIANRSNKKEISKERLAPRNFLSRLNLLETRTP